MPPLILLSAWASPDCRQALHGRHRGHAHEAHALRIVAGKDRVIAIPMTGLQSTLTFALRKGALCVSVYAFWIKFEFFDLVASKMGHGL